jgi:hypothetical protein
MQIVSSEALHSRRRAVDVFVQLGAAQALETVWRTAGDRERPQLPPLEVSLNLRRYESCERCD